MATIDKKHTPTYNRFIDQNKQLKDKISPDEWNTLWNVLAQQADQTSEHLKTIHDFITGGGDVSEAITLHQDAQSLMDYINNYVAGKIYVGPTEPDIKVEGMLWIQTEEE